MTTELTMPQMGYDMQEGTILRWLKSEGDTIENGEPIAEIETDKAVVEFESYAAGVLHNILVSAGNTVPVGEPIALIGDEAVNSLDDVAVEEDPPPVEAPSIPAAISLPAVDEGFALDDVSPAPEPVSAPTEPVRRPLRASPVARRIADERGINIADVQGTGPGGRITRDDVLSFVAAIEQAADVDEVPAPVIEPEPIAAAEEPAAEPVADIEAPVEPEPVADIEPEPVAATEEPAVEPVAEMETPVEPEPVAVVEPEPAPAVSDMEAADVPVAAAADVEAEPEPEPAPVVAADDGAKLSRMRQQIARVTLRSKTEKPHFYVTSEVDMTEAMALRQQVNTALAGEGVRITVNDLIIKACADALKTHPKFNAFLDGDTLRHNDAVNIGVAMAVDGGLLMPAIMGCEQMSLKEIALASKDLADRAQNSTLRPDEYTGGTFGISNLGMFDVSTFVAIIQPPQSAIIAVGTVAKKPVVRDDEIVVRQIMNATISADHRVVDGAEGAQFLIEVKRLLENPLSLIV